ncbi:MAG: RNA polymerase sigma-70 factor [Bacteroidales bacterium]|jgi:RNA polymerase sigma-70 factor (ECF subfamily)|nr:RNA polymerase sigma-70 factor [Bacteroidales bacterium]
MQGNKELTDEVMLVKELSRGNLIAFNTLFRCYSTRLYRFAYGYIRSAPECEELVQDVFTKIWEKRSDLKEELSFKSYLFTIAFNLIRKHFRTKVYTAEYIKSKINNDVDQQTTEKIAYDFTLQYIHDLVDRLPEKRREIFVRSRFEGQNIREIANDLSISHKTVENQLTAALKFLRENLRKQNITVLILLLMILL